MRKIILSLVLAFLLVAASLSVIQIARGYGPGAPNILETETQGENLREIQASSQADTPQQPDIGFIDSSTATCYQPDRTRDECHITWYNLSVDAYPNYMITMTLSLNDRGPVAHVQGFFQTSMYVPYSMLGDGFKVACGQLGAGGNAKLGNGYGYTVRARDSSGLSSANYGTVYCPAYTP